MARALHMHHRGLLAMSDRHNGRGAEATSCQGERYCRGTGSYLLDANTDGNPEVHNTARPRHRRARDCQYT